MYRSVNDKIVYSSSGTFSFIKSSMKISLVNEKISLTFNNLNSDKRGPVCLVNSE